MESFAPSSGWVAVLISFAAAVFLPIITMGIAAFCLPRKLTQNPDEHWSERARSLFPFKAIRIFSLGVLPILYATGANFYPDSMLSIPRWMFCALIFLASFGSTNWIIWRLRQRYYLQPESFWERLRKIGALAPFSMRRSFFSRSRQLFSRTNGTGNVQSFCAPDSCLLLASV